jgi:ABC-type glycerol-3-phosphate transport system substrate-binding protein
MLVLLMRALKWSILSLFCVLAAGILAFGPRPNRQLPPDSVVVDYWEKWTGNEEHQMRSIVDEFNRTTGAQQHIYVRYVSTAAINQKTLVATAAGVPPDIAGLYDWNLVQFAAMNALEPLETMAREHGIEAS